MSHTSFRHLSPSVSLSNTYSIPSYSDTYPNLPPVWPVASKKSPNVNKNYSKMISLEKLKILTPLQKLPQNVGDLGKLIVAQSPINRPIWSHCLPPSSKSFWKQSSILLAHSQVCPLWSLLFKIKAFLSRWNVSTKSYFPSQNDVDVDDAAVADSLVRRSWLQLDLESPCGDDKRSRKQFLLRPKAISHLLLLPPFVLSSQK